jgi:hypothetical protein
MTVSDEFWSTPRDFRLRLMRLEGATWEEIAEVLAVAPGTVVARAHQIGARRPPKGLAVLEDSAREPLPAGHPQAWSVLTEGTWLAGSRYPVLLSAGSVA